MIRFLYDWLVIFPADLFAGVLVILLIVIPLPAGFGAGALAYVLLEKRGHPDGRPKKHYFAITAAWSIGLYVAVVTGVAITRLPLPILRFLQSIQSG